MLEDLRLRRVVVWGRVRTALLYTALSHVSPECNGGNRAAAALEARAVSRVLYILSLPKVPNLWWFQIRYTYLPSGGCLLFSMASLKLNDSS